MAVGNLGYLRLKQGKIEEAEELIHEAYAINKRVLGNSHPLLVPTLDNLADVFRAQGREDEAEEVYQRALHLCENYLVATHPALALCLEHYAALLDSLSRSAEAERLRERARPVRACFEGQPAFAARPASVDLETAIQDGDMQTRIR
jgi:tetratricopeptide (TPR) repeat protein